MGRAVLATAVAAVGAYLAFRLPATPACTHRSLSHGHAGGGACR